jgi:hypothetical protein
MNIGILARKKILQIATGGSHTCLIANDYNTYCLGMNELLKKKKLILFKKIINFLKKKIVKVNLVH